MFIHEYVFDQKQTGKFIFDGIWKDLFKDRILDNKFIRLLLNDVPH